MTDPGVAERACVRWDGLAFVPRFRSIQRLHQGVSIGVTDEALGRQILRFDCYDELAHYHYDPDGRNERFWMDPAVEDHALDWALGLIERSLPQMAQKAGLNRAVRSPGGPIIAAIARAAAEVDEAERQTLDHYPGDYLIDAAGITFGVGYDRLGEGVSLRVLLPRNGVLEEMVGFDCHREPHYHYGPRRKNAVLPIDGAAIRDPLDWSFRQVRGGRLPAMLARAGYPDVISPAENDEIVRVFVDKVEPIARKLSGLAPAAAEGLRP